MLLEEVFFCMDTLHRLLSEFLETILSPLASWSPLGALVLISAVFGVVVAIVFRWTSNQQEMRRIADLCRAQVLAIKLFKDDPKSIFLAFGRLMKYSAQRMWCLFPSMIVILIPSVLLLVHLAVWYEHRPLSPGETTVIELQLADESWDASQEFTPELPTQLSLETPALRDFEEKSILWRIRVNEAGLSPIQWRVDSQVVKKSLAVSEETEVLSPVSVRRPGPGWWDRFLYPAEDAFSSNSSVRGIAIHHPIRSTPVFGWDIPWWLTVLLVSILAALLAGPVLKVQY